ncbi:MAG TPA: hypothetical protein VGN01_18020 [Acidobacteriaceae bacterium]|jgi:hypothetical protein
MRPAYRGVCILFVISAWLPVVSVGQEQLTGTSTADTMNVEPADLPDAPNAAANEARSDELLGTTTRTSGGNPVKRFHRVVQPNEYAAPLSSGDKLELAVMSRLTVSDVASTVFSAGWSHVRDSAPHYGTDSGAFGERLGALALKQTTQSIFSYGIYASLFHDDPRYYVMGRQKSIGRRALYSASCVALTQKDDGSAAINWPKFAGIASATALTNAYYPPQDRGFSNGAKAFGVSLGSSVLNNEIHEFIGDGLRLLHHRRD